jgi:anti-sigma-K factor RskA
LDPKRIAALEGRIAGYDVNNCGQFRELIEAYALGALDAEERTAFEAHLATGCKDCAQAVEEARWLVNQLAYLAPNAAPSDMLKARLMQTVRAEARAAQGSVQPKAGIPFWMWAGVAALLVLTVYSAWDARRLQKEIQTVNESAAAEFRQREQLQQELAVAKRQAHILTDANSKKFAMWPHDTQMPKLEAMWHPELGICVMGQKVPMPASNRTLQLWLIPKASGSKPMPSLTFWPDAEGKLVLMVENPPDVMADTKALAITEEPAGGSAQPTSAPMWVGGVS